MEENRENKKETDDGTGPLKVAHYIFLAYIICSQNAAHSKVTGSHCGYRVSMWMSHVDYGGTEYTGAHGYPHTGVSLLRGC